jgi:aminoglycoside phosphotransferase (APT) family kinase protein
MATMDRRGQEDFAAQFAVAVASMHQVTGGFFAENVIGPGVHATWADLCRNRLERLVKWNIDARVLPRPTIDAAEAYCKDLIAELPDDVVPVLTHRDLYLPNVIVTPESSVAIIDFEHASFFDRVWEFVKLEIWVFRRFPQLRSPFMEGYQSRSEWSRSCNQRLLLYEGIEYLAGVPYFGVRYPDQRMLKDFLDLLSQWLPH